MNKTKKKSKSNPMILKIVRCTVKKKKKKKSFFFS